jgi:hypothetical protein
MIPGPPRFPGLRREGDLGDTRPLDAGALRRVFLDLLSRPPYAAEREAWLGKERAELVDDVLAGPEYWGNWLEEQLYYFLLIDNFRPRNEAVRKIPAALSAGRLGVLEALHRVCLSSSFDSRNPGPDTFVTVVMEQLLGMTVQKRKRELEIGKKVYDGTQGTFLGRPGHSQSDVIRIALADRRALLHLLRREHLRLVRSDPSSADLQRWRAALEEDTGAFGAIVRAWVLSEAYDARLTTRAAMPNRLFVRTLFVDLMDRLPDDLESRRLRAALDGLANSGPLRSLVARLLLDSGDVPLPRRAAIKDPRAWIRALFVQFLGRRPSADEEAVFLESFSDPACRAETVVYAIVSHPEYQTW